MPAVRFSIGVYWCSALVKHAGSCRQESVTLCEPSFVAPRNGAGNCQDQLCLSDMNLLPFIHKFIDVQKKPVGLIHLNMAARGRDWRSSGGMIIEFGNNNPIRQRPNQISAAFGKVATYLLIPQEEVPIRGIFRIKCECCFSVMDFDPFHENVKKLS